MQSLIGKITGDSLTAAEWNQLPGEVQNVITGLGITLSSGDLNQLGKALAGYVANGEFYTDGGAANAYVLSTVGSKQAPPAYTDGMQVRFFPANTNTGASTVNVAGRGVKNIKTAGGNDPAAGALSTTKPVTLRYDNSAGHFKLPVVDRGIYPVDASVATNALTAVFNPGPEVLELDFRSDTLTNGTPVTRVIDSVLSLTISSGSTLGTVANVAARLVMLLINDAGAGVQRLGIVNLAGGLQLDETNLVTTTAEGGAGGADSASVIYTGVAVTTPSPYRVVGFIDITEATPGTWATAPTTVQGAGGNAATAMQSLGYGAKRQDVTGSRSAGTTYYNDSGRPRIVTVKVSATSSSATNVSITIDSVVVSALGQAVASTAVDLTVSEVVQPGSSYLITVASATISLWTEAE